MAAHHHQGVVWQRYKETNTMMIDEMKTKFPDRQKEIKVKIPLQYHVQLHTARILRGKTISSLVEEALAAYFDER